MRNDRNFIASPHSATASKQPLRLAGANFGHDFGEESTALELLRPSYRRHGCSAAWRSLATVQHGPRQKRTAVQDPTWRQRGGQRHFELH